MFAIADELSLAQKERRTWKMFALGVAILIVYLVGTFAYLRVQFLFHPQLVSAKSDLKPAALALNNNLCIIFSPGLALLDGGKLSTIPNGSFITPECFGTGIDILSHLPLTGVADGGMAQGHVEEGYS